MAPEESQQQRERPTVGPLLLPLQPSWEVPLLRSKEDADQDVSIDGSTRCSSCCDSDFIRKESSSGGESDCVTKAPRWLAKLQSLRGHRADSKDACKLRAADDKSPSRTRSCNAQKIEEPSRPDDNSAELGKKALALLNKLSVRNEATVVAQMGAFQLASFKELCVVADLLFQQALKDSAYCRLYCKAVSMLSSCFPTFSCEEVLGSGPAADKTGSPAQNRPSTALPPKSMSLAARVVQQCQLEFERLCSDYQECDGRPASGCSEVSLEADSEAERCVRRKERDFATVRLVGELFLCQVVSARVLAQVLVELLRSPPSLRWKVKKKGKLAKEAAEEMTLPPVQCVDCACELMQVVARQLSSEADQQAFNIILRRFAWLKEAQLQQPPQTGELEKQKKRAGSFAYPSRIRFKILNVLEASRCGWRDPVG